MNSGVVSRDMTYPHHVCIESAITDNALSWSEALCHGNCRNDWEMGRRDLLLFASLLEVVKLSSRQEDYRGCSFFNYFSSAVIMEAGSTR